MITCKLYIVSTLFTNIHIRFDAILGDLGLSSDITFLPTFLITQSKNTSELYLFLVTLSF